MSEPKWAPWETDEKGLLFEKKEYYSANSKCFVAKDECFWLEVDVNAKTTDKPDQDREASDFRTVLVTYDMPLSELYKIPFMQTKTFWDLNGKGYSETEQTMREAGLIPDQFDKGEYALLRVKLHKQ